MAYLASSAGTILGVVVPLAIVTALRDDTPSLLRWGWRVPFLLSVVAAGAALALRSGMVEPDEILRLIARDRRRAAELGAADAAEEAAAKGLAAGGEAEAGGAAATAFPAGAGDGNAAATAGGALGGLLPRLLHRRNHHHHAAPAPLPPAAADAADSTTPLRGRTDSTLVASTAAGAAAPAAAPAPANGHRALATATATATAATTASRPPPPPHPPRPARRHRRAFPLIPLLRDHWPKVVLQCAYTAMAATTSVTYPGWLALSLIGPPSSLPRALCYGSVLVALTGSALVGLAFARFLLDPGRVRPLHLSLAGIVLSVGVAPAAFIGAVPRLALAAGTQPAARFALLLVLTLCLSQAAFVFASLSASMSRLYPAHLRVSGFSLAHNVATSIFGGLAPIFMTSLQQRAPGGGVGPAAYLCAVSCLSAAACALLMRLHPRVNMLPAEAAEADAADALAEAGAEAEAALVEAKVGGGAGAGGAGGGGGGGGGGGLGGGPGAADAAAAAVGAAAVAAPSLPRAAATAAL